MSVSPDFNNGINEHLRSIKNYLNPDGTGSLADSLYAVRAIHTYAYNIHDSTEMSFSMLLRSYPKAEKAFSEFLNGEDMHDQDYFSTEAYDSVRRDHDLVLETQSFLKSYKNQVIHALDNRKVLS